MKLKTIINIVLILVSLNKVSAQQSEQLIMWENGDATSLKDLGKVTIEFKSGSSVKNVRIYEIQKAKGKIVYEKDGCLHDKNIVSIALIKSGRNSKHELYFELNNEPIIKNNASYDYLAELAEMSDFKVSFTAMQLRKKEEKVIVKKDTIVTSNTNFQIEIGTQAADTVVKANGEIVAAHIIHINDNEVRYKRADLLDGPIYSLPNSPFTEIIHYTGGMKIILKH